VLYHHHRGGGTNPVLAHDGLIYISRVTDEHSGHGPTPWDMLQVIDRDSGFTIAKHKPALRNATRPISASLVGDSLLYVTDNGGGLGATDDLPKLGVLQAGEIPKPIFDQRFVETDSHPVFDGDRMYVQAGGEALCFALDGQEGRAFQETVLAQRILRWHLRKPRVPPVTDIPPVAGYSPPEGLLVARMGTWTSPRDWLFAGAFPRGPKELDPLSALPGETRMHRIRLGTEITWQGTTRAFGPMPEGALVRAGTRQEYYAGQRSYRSSYGIRYAVAVDVKPHTCAYYFSALHAPRPGVYLPNIRGAGARLWVAGVRVADRQMIRLGRGTYPVLLRMDVGRLPPRDLADRMWIHVFFRRVRDPRQEYGAWVGETRAYRSWLKRIIRSLPGTALAEKAAEYLRVADDADRPSSITGSAER
jgi:hypothetical protein